MSGQAQCSNCGSTVTCGCQRRTASDGKQCCVSCIVKYEASIHPNSKKDDQVLTVKQALIHAQSPK